MGAHLQHYEGKVAIGGQRCWTFFDFLKILGTVRSKITVESKEGVAVRG